MKAFRLGRTAQPELIVELSAWEICKLLLGREVVVHDLVEDIVLRHQHAYDVLNMAAPKQ